jgi:hypothetical protein
MFLRVVHCKKEAHDVYIGRPSVWGNPFSHLQGKGSVAVSTRELAIDAFERMMRDMIEIDADHVLETYLRPIAGKVLGCWCAPKACHGDVLIKLCREFGLIE